MNGLHKKLRDILERFGCVECVFGGRPLTYDETIPAILEAFKEILPKKVKPMKGFGSWSNRELKLSRIDEVRNELLDEIMKGLEG